MTDASVTILIVDDDPTLLRLLGMLLRQEGYRVLAVDSAERALALLQTERPQLVITDLRMNGMDGLALFEAVRRESPLLPVIILTAHGTIPRRCRRRARACSASSPSRTRPMRCSRKCDARC